MRRVSNGLREGPPERSQACFAGNGVTAEREHSSVQRLGRWVRGTADARDGLTDSEVSMSSTIEQTGEGGLRT